MKATAVANSNMALVKYWGKRDSKFMLPNNGSISMTFDNLSTTTTVEFFGEKGEDSVVINDEELLKDKEDIVKHIDMIREMSGISGKARMVSESNFPIAAGIASSASGFAALSMAASKAAGLGLNERELSILSRRGSGSASRSIHGGFVEWYRGEKPDGSDSYAESIVPKEHWPEFRMITTIVSEAKKKVSSRTGMAQTVKTCPYYQGWLDTVNQDLDTIRSGVKRKDFTLVGSTAEQNCLKMHATMMTTKPSIIYWIPATTEIIQSVLLWREEGLETYFTIDAGPNVKVMCLKKDEEEVNKRLLGLEGVKRAIRSGPGDPAKLTEKHLF